MFGHPRKITHRRAVRAPVAVVGRFGRSTPGYRILMLYTIFIILAIIALLLFIFGRRRV
ncbi:hypothetical protein [Ilumatobacter fluminis]|uniref:hypothetical protein n=1 Tax=Ilumatobacter fluminis TaxID=467091 RepID=UPI001414E41E|nr:hypothetical protein [Ilumatobacter fluminis]